MSAWDRIETATNWQPAPNFVYYKEIFLKGDYRHILSFRVDQGFGYLLRYVTAAWYGTHSGIWGIAEIGNAPEIEYYVRRQSRQSDPVPLNLISSPGDDTFSDLVNANSHLNAAPLKSQKFENFFLQFGDTFEIHLIRDPAPFENLLRVGFPAQIVHLVLKGYNVPEPQARIW